MVFPSGDQTGTVLPAAMRTCPPASSRRRDIRQIALLRMFRQVGGVTVYAIHFPSGDNAGAPIRCIAARSS